MHRKQRAPSRPWLKKRGLRWPLIGLGVLALVAVVTLGTLAGTLGAKGNERAVLRMAHLAAIPSHASAVRSGGVGDSASGRYYLRFTAPAEEIARFIADSPQLRVRVPQALGPRHMYLPEARRGPQAGGAGQHVFYAADARFPWFAPAVRVKGRLYVIPADQESNSAEVIVDDAGQTVYVRVTHAGRGR